MANHNSIETSIDLKAPQSRVWAALTDHNKFGEWFRVKMDSPFIAGQTTKGHNLWPGYEHMLMDITIVELTPESTFSYTWHPFPIDKDKDYSTEPQTLVTFTLSPTATGTHLEVTETGFDKLPADRIAPVLRANTGGWQTQLKNIEAYVTQSS